VGFAPLPPRAAWRHVMAWEGFEVVWITRTPAGGHVLAGHSVAVEGPEAWAVAYTIEVDAAWRTTGAVVRARTPDGAERHLRLDATEGWRLDGHPAPHLAGCVDVDLEASACTNTLPVHRLALAVGDEAPAPATYVRAADLAVERLDQTYRRLDDEDGHVRFAYEARRFAYADVLRYDQSGLVTDYPGLAIRVA
jgi:uncharacterized protein